MDFPLGILSLVHSRDVDRRDLFGGGFTGKLLPYFSILKPFNARPEISCLRFSSSAEVPVPASST